MICLVCNEKLGPIWYDFGTHGMCQSDLEGPLAALGADLKKQLTEIILWADRNSDRSLQEAIGPSEIGTPCDRKLAYKLAKNPEVNQVRDPWAAIVGTSVHHWLEAAVNRYQDSVFSDGKPDFLTEKDVQVDPLVPGHVDLYRQSTESVIDYKTAGPDVMKKIRTGGPPAGYKIQTHLYGLGYSNAGRSVKHVQLVFLPRAGFLRDAYVWSDIYRPNVAQAALARMYGIKKGIEQIDIWNNPQVYDKIPAVADHCGYCPFYRKAGLMDGTEATDQGCPGV